MPHETKTPPTSQQIATAIVPAGPVTPPLSYLTEIPVAPAPMPGLTVGRVVHFVLPGGRNQGEHRPAIIVRVWDPVTGMVNLQVLTDGPNDGAGYESGMFWATSVPYSAGDALRSWHWPERA